MKLNVMHQSDNLIDMKRTMTATEVAPNFSDVLDAVVAGDEITITRGKRPIARLESIEAEVPNSVRLAAALEEHFEKYKDVPVDDSFDAAEYIRQLRDETLALDKERQDYLDELAARPYREELD